MLQLTQQKYYTAKEKKMKVKVIKDCYYNLEFIKAGRIIDFKGENLPSWATLADGIETKKKKKEEKPLDNVGQQNPDEGKAPVNPDDTGEGELDNVGQDETKEGGEAAPVNPDANGTEGKPEEVKAPEASPEEIEYLDKLINEGIEKNIFIEDADKKTVKEQIAELEAALKK